MAARAPRIAGFTLIELMITLTVVVVLLLIAIPSFQTYRQRVAVRGVTEQVQGLWQQARFEAAKRNTYIRFGVGAGNACIGAATQGLVNGTDIPTSANAVACDCTGADNTNVCDVFTFPASSGNNAEWRDVTVSGTPTLGNNTGVAILEPKNAMLSSSADVGAISFAGPPGSRSYLINFRVDTMGRGILCQSTSSAPLSDYSTRQCLP